MPASRRNPGPNALPLAKAANRACGPISRSPKRKGAQAEAGIQLPLSPVGDPAMEIAVLAVSCLTPVAVVLAIAVNAMQQAGSLFAKTDL